MNRLLPEEMKHIVLFPDDYYVNSNWREFRMDFHEHGLLEINYIAKGSCTYTIEGKEYVLKKKNLICFDSSRPHHMAFAEDMPTMLKGVSFISFPGRSGGVIPIDELLHNNHDLQLFSEGFQGVHIIHDAHTIEQLLQELINECSEHPEFTYVNLLVNKLFLDISRLTQHSNSSIVVYVNQIKEYIQENYFSITCLDEIASHVGLNKTYLQRIFKKQTGFTVWQYLTDTRMNAAASMLRNNRDICIGDVDEYVGINSRQNFYLLFRKKYGMSPLDYRKQFQSKPILGGGGGVTLFFPWGCLRKKGTDTTWYPFLFCFKSRISSYYLTLLIYMHYNIDVVSFSIRGLKLFVCRL